MARLDRLAAAVCLFGAMSGPSFAAINTDSAAKAKAAEVFDLLIDLIDIVAKSIGREHASANVGAALELTVMAPLDAAISDWEAASMEIGLGGDVGNHYSTYSDCSSAAYQLKYLAGDMVKFHTGIIPATEIDFGHSDLLISELRACGELLPMQAD